MKNPGTAQLNAVLRPTSVPALVLIKNLAELTLPSVLVDQLLELSLECIYEARGPASLQEWLARIESLAPEQQGLFAASRLRDDISMIRKQGLNALYTWVKSLRYLYPLTDEEDVLNPTLLHRCSPFGLYLRSMTMSLGKMSFDEAVLWWGSFELWCDGTSGPKPRLSNRARLAASYSTAKSLQDYHQAKAATSFYDVDDTGIITSSRPQYALLNTAFLEYEHGGWDAAQLALAEAIQVARRANDNRCLAACTSLAKRLERGPHQLLNDEENPLLVSAEVRRSPTDLLWHVKQLYSIRSPIPPLFTILAEARALYQSPGTKGLKDKGRPTVWNDSSWEPAYHATCALLWSEVGSSTLSRLRESMAIEALDSCPTFWDIRLSMISLRTTKLSASNQYEAALRLLFHSVETREKRWGMGLLELRGWEQCVWNVLRSKAERQENENLIQHLNRISPSAPRHSTTWQGVGYDSDVKSTDARSLLASGLKLMNASQPSSALPLLLRALHASSLRRTGSVQLLALCYLVECRITLSPTREEAERSERELDGVWSQILALGEGEGEGGELRARAAETRGRVGVVKGVGDLKSAQNALRLLVQAQKDYERIGLISSSLRVLNFLSRFYDHLSIVDSQHSEKWVRMRDETAARYLRQEGERKNRDEGGDWEEVKVVEKVVERVRKAVLAGLE